jgi:outer membrane protein OmpA-like peptidoglycan-associated protein
MKYKIQTMAVALCAAGLNTACGSALAPRELLDARDAYEKAKHGVAGQYALAQLESAKQSLQAAESAFSDGDEEETVNLAYVAERKAQLAEAAGEMEKASRERAAAIKERETAQEEYRKRTQAELSAKDKALEESRRAGQSASAELDAERQKRLAAEKRAAAALASLDELAKVKEDSRGVVITLSGSVLFATGKSDLLPIAREKLNEVAKALKDQGFKRLVVEGYTDSRGGVDSNMALSQRRADAVRSHLVSQGIQADLVTAVGKGEANPVADNQTAEGRANNRRVEIIVTPE